MIFEFWLHYSRYWPYRIASNQMPFFSRKNVKQLLNNWEMFPFTEENSTPHSLRVSILYQYHNTQ